MILAAVILCSSFFSVYAETIYTYKGFSYTVLYDDYISICGWDNSKTSVVVPAQLDGSYIKEIANQGMRNNEYITSIDMGNANYLTRIGSMAFKGCTGLNDNISVPIGITEIGDQAFQDCTGIKSFDFYPNNLSVPAQCCYNCSSLNKVMIADGVPSIEKLAFANCPSLEYVRIPSSVIDIKSSAFKDSPNVVINCYRDSYAEQFAKDNNIKYYYLDINLGDANDDGDVNILDVTFIQKYKIGIKEFSSDFAMKCADVNKSGDVTIRDATLIQAKIAKLINEF